MARRRFARDPDDAPVLVIGLGRFGSSVATSLVRQGREVLAIDSDPRLVQHYADELTHVVQADATDDTVLEQIGVDHFRHAVVAIGLDIEASVPITVALSEQGIQDIWAKAISKRHGQILVRVGAHRVIYPETSVGEQVAHMIAGGISQYLEFDDGFAIARVSAPVRLWKSTLGESMVRSRHGVTVVGIKRTGQDFIYALPEIRIEPADELVVAGPTRKIERFAATFTPSR